MADPEEHRHERIHEKKYAAKLLCVVRIFMQKYAHALTKVTWSSAWLTEKSAIIPMRVVVVRSILRSKMFFIMFLNLSSCSELEALKKQNCHKNWLNRVFGKRNSVRQIFVKFLSKGRYIIYEQPLSVTQQGNQPRSNSGNSLYSNYLNTGWIRYSDGYCSP